MGWGEDPEVTLLKEETADKIRSEGVEKAAHKQAVLERNKGGFQRLVEGIPVVGDVLQSGQRRDAKNDLEIIANASKNVKQS